MVTLKGFPTQIGSYIEIPDMGELLTYPFFLDNSVDDVLTYGSDFQKALLNAIPNLGKNGKKTLSVLSEVRLLAPNYRSCTGATENHASEWHIDHEEDEDMEKIWNEERDIVHLFTNKTSSMTQFFSNEIVIPQFTGNESYQELHSFVTENHDSLGIRPMDMPSNRIVTFTNHMHRATNPKGYEFKFMFRVTETDRKRAPGNYNPDINASTVSGLNGVVTTNILRQGDRITIFIPGFNDVHQQNVPRESYGNNEQGVMNLEIPKTQTTKVDKQFTTVPISKIGFELEHVSKSGNLSKFTPKNSIMLISQGEYDSQGRNQQLLNVFEKVNKSVSIISEDGQEIFGSLEKDFYDNDEILGKIAGAHIIFHFLEYNKIKPNVEYTIKINKENGFYYDIPENLKFSIKLPKLVDAK